MSDKPSEPQIMPGTPVEMTPKQAANNLRVFLGNLSGEGFTGSRLWLFLECVRTLESQGKGPPPAKT